MFRFQCKGGRKCYFLVFETVAYQILVGHVFDRFDLDDRMFLQEVINTYAETCRIVEVNVVGQEQVLDFHMDCDAPERESTSQGQDATWNGNLQLFC